MKIKSIIIEDDKLSKQLIQELANKISFVDLLTTYESAKDAFENIEIIKKADLIFLDVELPDMTGLEFLKNLEVKPEIIIISGKPDYALDAFEFEVTDYILKPPTLPRMLRALNKVKEKLANKRALVTRENYQKDTIFLKTDKGIKKFEVKNIYMVEAMENYVKIWNDEGVFMSHNTMKNMRELLPDNFVQVHRSFIVNLDHIKLIQSNLVVIKTFEGEKIIPIGKKYKDDLFNKLNIK
jgi:DNA-binding LytR/AlgR family response regulator